MASARPSSALAAKELLGIAASTTTAAGGASERATVLWTFGAVTASARPCSALAAKVLLGIAAKAATAAVVYGLGASDRDDGGACGPGASDGALDFG